MLKSFALAGGLVLASLSFALPASAASFGDQAAVAATTAPAVEQAQYGYGYRRRYRPRYYGPRRFYGPRRYYGRPYGYRRGFY